MKPPGVFSFCHPGCRNGKNSLKSGTTCRCMAHLPTKKTTSRPTSPSGMVAVSEVAAVAGIVRRGRKATYFPMVSQWGARPCLVDSVSSSTAAVIVSQPLVPPVPELAVPEY